TRGSDRGGQAAVGLAARLRAAAAKLPPTLGGAPRQPLEVGRATRVIAPAQRAALAVRDGGCVFPDCDRPLAWRDAHHLWHWAAPGPRGGVVFPRCDRPLAWGDAHHLGHWVDGGPAGLGNLALVCRAHHRRV